MIHCDASGVKHVKCVDGRGVFLDGILLQEPEVIESLGNGVLSTCPQNKDTSICREKRF